MTYAPQIGDQQCSSYGLDRELEDDEREVKIQGLARGALDHLKRVEGLKNGGDLDRMRMNLRRHGNHCRLVAELDGELSALRIRWADFRREIRPRLGRLDPLGEMAEGEELLRMKSGTVS